MKTTFPDYDHCITAVPNSILKHFGAEEGRKTSALLDSCLKKEYENIVVLLLDGVGKRIIDRNLDREGFFQRHLKGVYSSVFPPTTVAATASMLSGRNPCEHRWLGRDCYFPQIDRNVTVFSNKETDTGLPAADYPVASRYCGYEDIVQRINRICGKETAYYAAPFAAPYPKTFEDVTGRIAGLCSRPGRKFIYAYWNEPDWTMHRKGCHSEASKALLRELEAKVEKMCGGLDNTLLLVTADHGLMDSECVTIEDYPKLLECLVRLPSIEPRALNLFVKPEKKERFLNEFQKEFGEKFLLLSKEEVIQRQLFGLGKEHPSFRNMLGDYLAVAVSDLTIYRTKEEVDTIIAVHAGLTEAEMEIPLIIVEK